MDINNNHNNNNIIDGDNRNKIDFDNLMVDGLFLFKYVDIDGIEYPLYPLLIDFIKLNINNDTNMNRLLSDIDIDFLLSKFPKKLKLYLI